MIDTEAIVLVNSSVATNQSFGTGFVIASSQTTTHILTCDHVVTQMGDPSTLQAAGCPATLVASAPPGLDLAILAIDTPGGQPMTPLALATKVGENRSGDHTAKREHMVCGFQPLYRMMDRTKVIRESMSVSLTRPVQFQVLRTGRSHEGWFMTVASDGQTIREGMSGSPVLWKEGKKNGNVVVAIVTDARVGESPDGWSLSLLSADARAFLTPYLAQLPPAVSQADSYPRPDDPPITNIDDPQNGRWGGKSEHNGRKLGIANLTWDESYLYFDVVVSSTDGSPLQGPVRFHLHDTYSRNIYWIRKIQSDNTAILQEVNGDGVYTIGAQVRDKDGNWIGLEYDLARIRNIPKRFFW